MIDAQSALASPAVTRREDYQPPDWLVPDIALDFDLDPGDDARDARCST